MIYELGDHMMRISPAVAVHTENERDFWLETSTGVPATTIGAETAEYLQSIRNADDLSVDEFHEAVSKAAGLTSSPVDAQPLSVESLLTGTPFSASGYHLATRNHPFLDMSRGMEARVADAQIMAGFVEADDYPDIVLNPESDLEINLEDAAHLGLDEVRNSMICQLSLILSGTFGARRHQAPYYDPESGYRQVELIKKSIPSGGSRHPSDCFVYVHRSPSLEKGPYYFNARRHSLFRIKNDTLGRMHEDDVVKSSADWVVTLAIGSVVRRAMFRYRDPRSFRAILVDAGHADGQIAALASYCNWKYRSRSNISFSILDGTAGLSSAEAPVLISGILEGWE